MSAKTELLGLLNDPRINEIYVDGLRSVKDSPEKGTAAETDQS